MRRLEITKEERKRWRCGGRTRSRGARQNRQILLPFFLLSLRCSPNSRDTHDATRGPSRRRSWGLPSKTRRHSNQQAIRCGGQRSTYEGSHVDDAVLGGLGAVDHELGRLVDNLLALGSNHLCCVVGGGWGVFRAYNSNLVQSRCGHFHSEDSDRPTRGKKKTNTANKTTPHTLHHRHSRRSTGRAVCFGTDGWNERETQVLRREGALQPEASRIAASTGKSKNPEPLGRDSKTSHAPEPAN